MSTFPGSPRLIKGGIVLIDPDTSAVQRVITLQYNPDTLIRALQVQGVGGEGGDRSEALRFTGPRVETLKLDDAIDATDQLESADKMAGQYDIQPHPSGTPDIFQHHRSGVVKISCFATSYINHKYVAPVRKHKGRG